MGKKGGGRVRIKQMGPKGVGNPSSLLPTMDDLAIPNEEMINLPPPPDRSYQIFWPIHETFTMKIDDHNNFRIIYPSYIDSNKTCQQGRKLSKSKSINTPTVTDMSQALQSLQVRHVIQPYKGYSRDITCLWDNPGRIIVDVSQYSKTTLMEKIAERIPYLPARKLRLEQQAAMAEKAKEEMKIEQEKAGDSSSLAAGKATMTGNKKKGKKGKRK